MHVVGLDIGGANLKAASTAGEAFSEPFEIWRAPGDLTSRIAGLLARFPRADRLAVTMTAELADCFETKRDGVVSVLAAVERAGERIPVRIWTTNGRFVEPAEARERPMEVAAANWSALAVWAGRWARKGESLLFDVGSTTADLIPLRDGRPCSSGFTDVGRLLAGELVYTGVRRTPVFALAPDVPLRGKRCPFAAEWFATTLDVYLIVGWLPENPADCGTANGRPMTIHCARDRLARSVCCDRTELTSLEIQSMAEFLAARQMNQLSAALDSMCGGREVNLSTAIVSGEGEFLARRVLKRHPATADCRIISLTNDFTRPVAEAACAYAVAVLANEQG